MSFVNLPFYPVILIVHTIIVLIGGMIAFTFFKAAGYDTGENNIDKKIVPIARKLLKTKKIILPTDITNIGGTSIPAKEAKEKGYDIGPMTTEAYSAIIQKAKTILWNGPLGWLEKKHNKSTKRIAKEIAKQKAITIIGGGDTIAVIKKLKLEKKITHLSTGGSATLQFLAGEKMPGIEALK